MSLVNFEVQQPYITPSQLLLAMDKVIPSQTITKAIISTSSVEQSATIAGISPLSLSFTGSLRVIRRAIPLFQQNIDNSTNLNIYISWLTSEILDLKIPPPQNRTNPRVVKKTRSKYKTKKRSHRNNSTPRQQLSFEIFQKAS
jgi:hypothetical protein